MTKAEIINILENEVSNDLIADKILESIDPTNWPDNNTDRVNTLLTMALRYLDTKHRLILIDNLLVRTTHPLYPATK